MYLGFLVNTPICHFAICIFKMIVSYKLLRFKQAAYLFPFQAISIVRDSLKQTIL